MFILTKRTKATCVVSCFPFFFFLSFFFFFWGGGGGGGGGLIAVMSTEKISGLANINQTAR